MISRHPSRVSNQTSGVEAIGCPHGEAHMQDKVDGHRRHTLVSGSLHVNLHARTSTQILWRPQTTQKTKHRVVRLQVKTRELSPEPRPPHMQPPDWLVWPASPRLVPPRTARRSRWPGCAVLARAMPITRPGSQMDWIDFEMGGPIQCSVEFRVLQPSINQPSHPSHQPDDVV